MEDLFGVSPSPAPLQQDVRTSPVAEPAAEAHEEKKKDGA